MTISDINKKMVQQKKDVENSEKNEVYHVNNMVGVDLKKNEKSAKKDSNDKLLSGLSKNVKSSRVLLDLFAVSINPKVSPNGWRMIKKKETNIDNQDIIDLVPRSQLKLMLPHDFFEYFISVFEDILKVDTNFVDIGGGEGFNSGRKYVFKDTIGAIQFRYFDPLKADESKIYTDGPIGNYVRQKINLKITGDGLQVLRSSGLLVSFLVRLYNLFECDVTMFDATLDMFNYNLIPISFVDLYKEEKYIGKSSVNVMGDALNPSVYIGKYKSARSIIMYDKFQEAKDKKTFDEPEIIEALKLCNGNWFRLEQHFSREHKESAQAFNYLMFDIVNSFDCLEEKNEMFAFKLSSFLKQQVEKKCRFLKSKRKEKNNERIENHKNWDLILNAISNTNIDFAFSRPVLTLEQRKFNFKYFSQGGINLFEDIIAEEGMQELERYLKDVIDYANERYLQSLK